MAIDYELLRKKAKKRDEEKQKRDNYEYSKSMYEGATKNRDNISAGTYKLYYDDYKRNTKAYAKEQKKSINESSGKQLKSVLNMINPFDSVSSSQAKKNFQSAQKSKEEKRTAYDKLKEEYERTNGVGQKKNSILSRMEYVTDKLSGEDTTSSEHKVESADMQNKSKNSQMQYLKESAYYEKQDENNKILKNNEISKLVDLAYQSKLKADISLKEYNRSKQSGQVAFGDNVSAENYTMYDKSYKSAVKEIKKRGYDAESLIDTYSKNMNKQETKKITDSAKEFADKHPVLSRGAYVAAQIGQVAAVPDMIKQGVKNAVSDEYRPMDTNTSGFIATNFRNAVQEENTKNLYNYVKKKSGSDTAGKVVSFLDQTGLSVADMLSIAYLPEPVTLGIMSCGAAANTAVEATERGLSADKALYTATAAGIAESLFEKISLDKFKGLQATGRTGVFNAVTDALKQSFTEGSEEAFTDISNAITDQIINGDMSELSLKYNNYIKEGATKQQAKSTVAKDFGLQVGESFLGGALSGVVVGSVGTAINKYAFNDVNARELGDEVKNSDEIKSLIDTGLSKDKKSKAYKYAEELQNKAKKYKNSNAYNNVDVLAGDSINDSEIDYSKLNAKRLGQLQTEIVKEGFKENIANAVKGEENKSRINKVINKMINGFDLTKYDAKSIADSDKAINAINEQFGSDFTKENISVSSLADLSTKLKSGYTNYSFTYDGYNKYQQRAENAQNEVFEENTQSVTDDVKMPKEVLTAEHQSDNPRYNVNATVTFEDGQQANVRIDSRHPFEINRDSAELKLRTSAGKISYNDISIENNLQKLLVNEIASANFGDAGANAVYLNLSKNEPKNFNGDIRTYVSQAKLIYDLGVAKPDVPFSEFVKKNPVFNSSIKLLGDSAINIYRAGQTDTLNYDKYVESLRDNKKSPAKTERHIEGDYTNISNSDSTIDDVFIKVAKKTRVDIERHSDGRKAGNGQFVPSLAKIIINADGSGEYNALIHELGEFGLAYNEKEYKKIQSAIRDWYVDFRGAENFNALVDAYIDTYTKAEGSKTRAEAIDELTNDAVSGLFSTDEGIEDFAKWLDENKTEPEKKSIIETITDFLKSVIEKIKNVIATSNLQMAARDAMEMEQKRAENIRKQFLDMLDNASENLYNGTEVEENTKNSVTLGKFADVDINSNEKLDKYGIPNTARTLNDFVNIQKRVISTLDNDNFFNQNNKNIVVNADTDIVVSITRNGIRETLSIEKRYVKLPRKIKAAKIAVIDNLPDMIRYAEVVNENEKNYHSKEGSPFLILSHPAIVDGENYDVEIKIRKTPAENKFYIHNMNLLNKNETVALSAKDKISKGHNNNELSRTDNIANNASNVNNNETKFSLDIDSDGNKLTQQQAEYFKNSKVRDENGNLLKVYHGTTENFTVFDKTKGRANMDIQGMFFSPLEIEAKDYGSNVNAYYINITNPASERMGYMALRKFQGQNNAGVKAREYLESLGYDGVNNNNEEYIAFNSNQIKLADNLTPSENEDIRFSRDVNIDEFDETEYTNVKLSKTEYNKLYSEALTWDSNKVGQICYKYFNNKRYYYILNENYDIKILGVYNSNDKKGAEYKNVDRKRRNISSRHEVSENTNGNDRSHNGFVSNGRTATNNAELNKEEIQREGNGNRTRIVENDDNDNLSEEKYSRDVEYSDYLELKRENKHLKEINEVLKHQFELTNGREVSTKSLLKAARKIIKLTPTRMTGADVEKEMKSWHTLDTSQQFFNAAYDLAQKLVENEKQLKYQPTQEEQEMLDYLKNTEIKLSDKQKEEVSYYFGSYGKYKNAARGKINITENGILLDDLANEMEEMFGNLMPSDNSQDLPIALLDMVNTYKNKVIENVYGYSKEEYLESLANDILSYYFKTNLYETKADKNEKRFLKARSKYAQQISNYQKLLADEKAKHKKEFSEFRKEQVHKNQQYRSDLYRDTIQYKAEFRKNFKEEKLKAEYRKRIKRNLLRLASLAKQTKTKHIPNNMVESVRDLCYTVTTDTKFDDKILDKVKNLNDSFTRLSADKTDTYHYITNLYNEWLMKDLAALENSIGNKTVAMLNSTELSKLDDIISMTLTTIGKANKLFGYERNKTIEKSVSKVKEEIESISVKQIKNKYLQSLGYNSMKPEYFFEYLGSDELLKLYRDVRKGEDTWALTISDSKNFADDIRKKYNWKSWNFDKITEYKSLLGEKLKFDLQDLMSLYAFSRREQAKNHILHGGIKFADTKNKKKSNEYSTHKLSKQDLKYLTDLLTEEQKEYVRNMVKYLSTDMAEKGNEVTRQLYDVELFKEENYFPMKVDGDSVKEKSTEVKGTKKIKNSGMTNATVEGAEQALILDGFDSVWATHIDDMAKYHAFTLPLENFDKVYNYSDIDVSNKLTSIKEKIKNKYGNEAISYISKLIENINGGVVREPGTDIADKFVSMFKKNAVFASASVAIQQPSAIGRALSIIDTKYFAKTTFTKRSYDEIKKYAPVAIIKEMGYFDTNMAQSTVDYLNNADYKGKEKIAAFFKDGAFRDEAMGYFASKADEITWAHIWNACKAETKDKFPDLSTEESLQKAGKRFTEVITKTQVYDSVFSRSALMRSKNGAVKMATAFMAEPTTSLNMLFNATVQAKRGKFSKKKATRIVASLVIASVINALLQSIVTAARNDDDDKTYAEKYIAELIPNFIDNANPVNQIAFLKDAISALQGYDVTRADMSVFSDLYNSIHNMNSDNLTYTQKIESLAGSIGAFFGLPIKNVIRDINSVENVIKGAKNGNSFNPSMAKEATQPEIKEALLTDDVLAIFGLDLFPEKDKQQMIYEAIENGDKEMYKRLADNVSNPDNYIKKGLIENDKRVAEAGLAYLDSDISKAISTAKELEDDGFNYELSYKAIKSYSSEIQKAAGYKAEGEDKKYKEALETLISSGTDKKTVEKAIDKVDLSKESSDNESKLYNKQDLVNAINSGDESVLKTVIDSNIATDISNGKTKTDAEKSIKSSLKSAFKEEYLAADNSKRSQIKTKLKSTGYFDDEDFTNWEASAYNSEAMLAAFKSNDTSTIKKYVNGRIKAKVKNGMTQDNAVFGIRTSITNMYKEKYIKGNADEKAKIITIMTKTGVYGSRTDVISYIKKYWLK
uniref:PolyVal ADP-ribosyltransferase n=1 Tax=Siphoviridae sp. ctLR131 TaxID=2826250 RepID=A0A8S5MP18_9CAUD|nr:MAG TPA: PolyVal ADP-ribosyltransferase [Siphoviridae sp. ctLR131]